LLNMIIFSSLSAEFSVNALFSDNMVIQREQSVSIYGTADANEEINVEFAGQRKQAKANETGFWEVKLDSMTKSFESRDLKLESAKSNRSLTLHNILVGDVWLCGGQSNMEFPFKNFSLLQGEVDKINKPYIRSMVIKRRELDILDDKVIAVESFSDAWHEARQPWVMPLSVTAYYFAEKVNRSLDVPVGLIVSAVGGSQIQRWLPKPVVEGLDVNSESSNGAGVLYNGMIYPLRKFTIKGVIWYQGESNAGIPESYYSLSKTLITTWRKIWAENNPHLETMPFFTVQLAPFNRNVDGLATDAWAYIRDAQLKTLSLPNTGLVVTTDLGEFNDIHPQMKKPVGERLALWAEKLEKADIIASGPLFEKVVITDNKAQVHFSNIGSGLETRKVTMSSKKGVWAIDDPDAFSVPADQLEGFSICGADQRFVSADAAIIGDYVEVFSKEVSNPIAVRYGWLTFPLCNLYNKEGLPASPFRSDDFPIPDVQGRLVGKEWDRDEGKLGFKMEMIKSTVETDWAQTNVDGLSGFEVSNGKKIEFAKAYYKIENPDYKDGKKPDVLISIIYLDNNTDTLSIQYDSSDINILEVKEHPGAWKPAAKIKLNNTGKWRLVEILIKDGLFKNRCNDGDLRINANNKTILGAVYYR
jgi:hypothetical protein